jgi:tRNA 5-methylaminomethyl-2-thiouridine biosynthesis bifunctional protein
MADFLVSRINGDPLPLEYDLVRAIAPERFLLKATDGTKPMPGTR